jgi:hypothetical protein
MFPLMILKLIIMILTLNFFAVNPLFLNNLTSETELNVQQYNEQVA